MVFVDDYTAWVMGPIAIANHRPIEAIVERVLQWEWRSGATFEGKKTSFVYFTQDVRRMDTILVMVKGELVTPKNSAKVLGVVMDSELRFKE